MRTSLILAGVAFSVLLFACEPSPPPPAGSAATRPGAGTPATVEVEERTAGDELRRLAQEIEQRAREGAAATRELIGRARGLYETEVRRELDRLDERIDELERRAATAAEEARPEIERRLADLRRRADDGREALRRIAGASDEAWEELRRGAEGALRELRAATTQPVTTQPPPGSAPTP